MSTAPRHASATRVDEDVAVDNQGAAEARVDESGTDESSADVANRRPARLWPRVIGHLLATLMLAAVALLTLEWGHALNDPWVDAPERLGALKPWVLAVSGLAIWGFVGVLHALTGRLWLTTGLTLAGTAFIAFADFFKMEFRSEPLFPTDAAYLAEAGLLVDSLGAGWTAALFAGLAAVVAVPWGVSRLVRWLRRTTTPRRVRGVRALAVRAALGMTAGLVAFAAVTFNQDGNLLRRAYDEAGVYWAPWSQLDNYAKNGFVAAVLYNLPATAMDEPEGYGPEAMGELVARYRTAATAINANRDPAALADTNIVLVLAESVTDPTILQGVEPTEDPLPFLRELMSRNTSGELLVSGYGGGTANVEFEALTGLAMANYQAQVHSAFQMLVAQRESFPSHLARFPDHATLTLHPYVASFYRREVVYPVFGFERSEFITDMGHTEKIESDRYVSDAAVYAEVLDELRASDRPLLINAVTMQNHGPQTGYADPIEAEGPFGGTQAESIGQYLRGLKYSDEAIAQLVADLDAFEERTIVLFYGDHNVPIWPQAVLDANPPQAQFTTPWVVFANFDTFEVDPAATISPNLLVNQLLTAAGAPVTPLDALLLELEEEVPALGTSMVLDPAGRIAESEDQLSPRARELLADYRLVQYDLSVGEGYVADALYAIPPAR
jgi:phosphoglycerol transferase MdoB-like AlkP superfamily enzyme